MPFSPSLQALIGDHTAQYSGNTQCCVDWVNQKAYIQGITSAVRYISRVGLISGVQEAFASTAAFTHPPSADTPIQIDASGNLYDVWSGLNGGGITKIDSSTLTQISFSGVSTSNFPLGYPGLPDGSLANISVSGTQFILAGSIGGFFGILDYSAAFNEELFAGRQQLWSGSNPGGFVCAGPLNSNVGYNIVSESGSPGTQIARIYKFVFTPGGSWTVSDWPVQNSLITSTEIFDLHPTDIDAGWTEIHNHGLCIDQSDGNLIISFTGQSGAGTASYIVKVNATSGAVIWKVSVPDGSTIGVRQMQFSLIRYSRFAFFTNTGHTVTIINTADGSTTTETSGLAGITSFGYQCYNDKLGAIILNCTFSNTTGSPTRLNSTPTSYTGWSVLYVAPPPPAPSNPRRFLAECGPIRVIQ